jgi:hypothetical protein
MLFVTYYWHGMAKSIKNIKSTFANELQSDMLESLPAPSNPLETIQISSIIVGLPSYRWRGYVPILPQLLWIHYKPLAWKTIFSSSRFFLSFEDSSFGTCHHTCYGYLGNIPIYSTTCPGNNSGYSEGHNKKDEFVHYQYTNTFHTYGIAFVLMIFRG